MMVLLGRMMVCFLAVCLTIDYRIRRARVRKKVLHAFHAACDTRDTQRMLHAYHRLQRFEVITNTKVI